MAWLRYKQPFHGGQRLGMKRIQPIYPAIQDTEKTTAQRSVVFTTSLNLYHRRIAYFGPAEVMLPGAFLAGGILLWNRRLPIIWYRLAADPNHCSLRISGHPASSRLMAAFSLTRIHPGYLALSLPFDTPLCCSGRSRQIGIFLAARRLPGCPVPSWPPGAEWTVWRVGPLSIPIPDHTAASGYSALSPPPPPLTGRRIHDCSVPFPLFVALLTTRPPSCHDSFTLFGDSPWTSQIQRTGV